MSVDSKLEKPLLNDAHLTHEFLFHLVQADLWAAAVAEASVYLPPTYAQDGFTHGTANPTRLLLVANHFYRNVPGDWLCLRMTTESLAATGIDVVFESTAPVGDKPADFDAKNTELFPHLQGGIHPDAVLGTHAVERSETGEFLAVAGVTT